MKSRYTAFQLELWSQLQHLPDEDIVRLFNSSPVTLGKPAPSCEVFVRRICQDAVVKLPVDEPAEARNIRVVRLHTSVPVPAVLRETIDPGKMKSRLVMEYITGRTLEQCWSELSFLRKLCIIWTLRGYVRQLRRIPHTVPWPGPVGDRPQTCYGQWFSTLVSSFALLCVVRYSS